MKLELPTLDMYMIRIVMSSWWIVYLEVTVFLSSE